MARTIWSLLLYIEYKLYHIFSQGKTDSVNKLREKYWTGEAHYFPKLSPSSIPSTRQVKRLCLKFKIFYCEDSSYFFVHFQIVMAPFSRVRTVFQDTFLCFFSRSFSDRSRKESPWFPLICVLIRSPGSLGLSFYFMFPVVFWKQWGFLLRKIFRVLFLKSSSIFFFFLFFGF